LDYLKLEHSELQWSDVSLVR